MREVNFLGLGFENGQSHAGLAQSYVLLKEYFSLLPRFGIRAFDQGHLRSFHQATRHFFSFESLLSMDWSPYKKAISRIHDLYSQDRMLVNWGGDHSMALSTVGAFCRQFPDGYVLWIDAHADLNTPEESLSGHLHGMPLSILMNIHGQSFDWIEGRLEPSRLIYLGLSDVDSFERKMIQDLGITSYFMSDLRERTLDVILEELRDRIKDKPIHVSFDIDSLCPTLAPATGTPVNHGLTLCQLERISQFISKINHLKSMDVAEVNPWLGSPEDVFRTYTSAIRFLKTSLSQGGVHERAYDSNQTKHASSLEQAGSF